MSVVEESLFIRALRKEPIERTPIWLMRQAGRYLPEYRAVRQKAGDFLTLCKTPELACEVTLQPLRRFDLDAAILFSDILTIPDALGLGLEFCEGEGPRFKRPISGTSDIEALAEIEIYDALNYVMEAVRLIRREMPTHLPLIGFSGSPWTLACYMIDGSAKTRDFKSTLQLMYTNPNAMHDLLKTLTTSVRWYLQQQILAGANALMIFDTWGGLLTTPNYLEFSLHYMSHIVQALKAEHPNVPIILFTKGGGVWLKDMIESGCDALGLDWTCSLAHAKQEVGSFVALQGNLDPAVLRTSVPCIRKEVKQVLASYGLGSGHVFNLGHGITPDVLPQHISALVDAVRDFSPEYHT